MSAGTLTTVDFHGATLLALRGETPETTLVAMKPVVEGMGLDWSYQLKKLKGHPVLSKGVAVIAIPSDGGIQEVTALTLTRLNFWLATVHPDRIKDQVIRAKIIEYQTECADVLFAHFFGQPISGDVAKPEPAFHTKPHDEWSAEDLRTKMAEIHLYRRTMNTAAALWMMRREGFPMPPDQILSAWQRQDTGILGLTITVGEIAR